MALQGLRDTSNFVADQRPKNWRESVLLLYPRGFMQKSPLFALTSLMKSQKTDDYEFNWWEKSFSARRMQLGAAIATTVVTTITLTGTAAYSELRNGHILRVEHTGELLLVNGDPSSNTVSVVRGFAGSTATAIANIAAAGVNPYVHVVGSVFEQGSAAPTGINYDPTKRTNYCQIARNTLEMTRTAQKTRLRTGDQVKEAKRECLEFHSADIEWSFIFGKPAETTINGKPAATTGGIIHFMETYGASRVVDQAGVAVDMDQIEIWLAAIFKYGSSEKLAFCGNTAMLAIQQAVRKNTNYQIFANEKEYGINVMRLVCPFGTLVLKPHILFNQFPGGTTGGTAYYGLDSWVLVIDQANLVYRFVDDTKYQPKLEDNGIDGMQSGYLTECGLEVHHPDTHYLIKGFASGAVDD